MRTEAEVQAEMRYWIDMVEKTACCGGGSLPVPLGEAHARVAALRWVLGIVNPKKEATPSGATGGVGRLP